ARVADGGDEEPDGHLLAGHGGGGARALGLERRAERFEALARRELEARERGRVLVALELEEQETGGCALEAGCGLSARERADAAHGLVEERERARVVRERTRLVRVVEREQKFVAEAGESGEMAGRA